VPSVGEVIEKMTQEGQFPELYLQMSTRSPQHTTHHKGLKV